MKKLLNTIHVYSYKNVTQSGASQILKMLFTLAVLVALLNKVSSVIYHLNDTEYDRIPPLHAVDDYGRCLRHGGTYCLARIDLFSDPPNDLMNLIQDYSAHAAKHYNYTFVDRGVCMNTKCRKFIQENNQSGPVNLSAVLERCLNESIWDTHQLQSRISHLFGCNTNTDDLDTDWIDWAVLGIIALIILLNAAGSFYDIAFTTKNAKDFEGNPYLLSFSTIRNAQWMVTMNSDDPRFESLKVFDGIRAIVAFFVVLAHVMFLISIGFTDNPHEFEKAYEYGYYHVIFNGLSLVQIFFTISGFLLVYILQNSGPEYQSWSSLPKIVFYRWWRLTPVYALLIAFNATWLRHLGSGPVWKQFVAGGMVADCRKYWWLHLLYINNFEPDDKVCALQTWHIAADMQLFLLGLLVYFGTQRRGRNITLAVLILASMVIPALHVWIQDYDGLTLVTPELYRRIYSDTFNYMHTRWYTNISSYIIGMAVGYLVCDMQKNNVDLKKYKLIPVLCWFGIPTIIGVFYSGRMFYVDGERASLPIRMVYAATHRAVIGVITGYGIVGLLMKFSDFFGNLFGWRGWLVPAKLSYAVYLLHMTVVFYVIGSRHQPVHVSFFNLIFNFLGVVVLSHLLAVPVYLMVEVPMSRLMKAALRQKLDKQKSN